MINKASLKLAVLAAGLTLGGALQASTLSFTTSGGSNSSSNSYGNEWTFTTGGVNVEATAWGLTSLSADFAAGQLGKANGYGLWVCNQSEGINCSSPTHQIDNKYGYEFVLFQFSEAVDLSTLSIRTYNNADLDVTYFTGNTAPNLSLAGVNLSELASLGLSAAIHDDSNTTATSRSLALAGNNVTTLLVGARLSGDSKSDYFKIKGLSVDPVSDVPEPSTVALTGAALMALGLYGRRRKA